jgi:hypothetical protein
MSKDDEYKQFSSNHELDNDRLVVEVPADPMPFCQPKIPSGFTPMERIYLNGIMYRKLAGGRVPWWVLIGSWIGFGSFTLMLLITAIPSASLASFLSILLFAVIPLIILLRGTIAKLSIRKRRRRRR